MKYQVLFSQKNNEKVFINVVCCSRNWRFKDYRGKQKKTGKKKDGTQSKRRHLKSKRSPLSKQIDHARLSQC